MKQWRTPVSELVLVPQMSSAPDRPARWEMDDRTQCVLKLLGGRVDRLAPVTSLEVLRVVMTGGPSLRMPTGLGHGCILRDPADGRPGKATLGL